jgi:hypothetical protein
MQVIAGIPSASMLDNLGFQGMTKYEPLVIHIVNIFWMSIELSNVFSDVQHQSIVKKIEVYKTNLYCARSLSG